MQELSRLDAMAQAELVRRGEVSPRELVDAAIARIEKTQPAAERRRSRRPSSGRAPMRRRWRRSAHGRRPFRGVPFLMKDIGGTGSRRAAPHGHEVPEARELDRGGVDATSPRSCARPASSRSAAPTRRSSALLPTTEPEAYGATRNPWNLGHSAGGSSGGAAAAVAAGIVPRRTPATAAARSASPLAHCGLVGLKPTRARASFGPGAGERWSGFSCEHVVTRSVRDTAALLDVVAGRMPGDPYAAPPPSRPVREEVGADPGRLRIGVLARLAARGRARSIPTCRRGRAHRGARCSNRSGTASRSRSPEAYRRRPGRARSYVTLVASQHRAPLDAVGEKLGRTLGAGRRREHDLGGRARSAARRPRRRTSRRSSGRTRSAAAWRRGGRAASTCS